MNEAYQLKILVERVVRPVQASIDRKRKMRAELLAHVSAVFEEEHARLGDAQAALTRTQQRFGPPAELTAQLQTTIPGRDRFTRFVEAIEAFRPGESMLRRATRHAVMFLVVFGAAVLPVFLVKQRFREWPIIPGAAVLVFCFTLACNALRAALYGPAGRSWPRAVVIAGVSTLFIPGVTFALCWIFTGEAESSLQSVLPLVPWALLLAWVPVAITAHLTEKELRYRREWDTLQTD
jgi:ATP-dependent Clp protease ATP-binding subunit ClpC